MTGVQTCALPILYLSKRYTVLEFWGYLSGLELRQAGVEGIDDDHAMYLSNVWVCGNFCIKIAISGNQSKRIPFFVVPYEKVPYKIWGRGVPEKMADPQAVINASARAMVENMGMALGTIADNGNFLALDEIDIGILIVIDAHDVFPRWTTG